MYTYVFLSQLMSNRKLMKQEEEAIIKKYNTNKSLKLTNNKRFKIMKMKSQFN